VSIAENVIHLLKLRQVCWFTRSSLTALPNIEALIKLDRQFYGGHNYRNCVKPTALLAAIFVAIYYIWLYVTLVSNIKMAGASYASRQLVTNLSFTRDNDHSMTSVICSQMTTPLQIFVLKCLYSSSSQCTLHDLSMSFFVGMVFHDVEWKYDKWAINGKGLGRNRPLPNGIPAFAWKSWGKQRWTCP
jgi:hypothetical protein